MLHDLISQVELEFLERIYNRIQEKGLLDNWRGERELTINLLNGSIVFKSSGKNDIRSMYLDEYVVKWEGEDV